MSSCWPKHAYVNPFTVHTILHRHTAHFSDVCDTIQTSAVIAGLSPLATRDWNSAAVFEHPIKRKMKWTVDQIAAALPFIVPSSLRHSGALQAAWYVLTCIISIRCGAHMNGGPEFSNHLLCLLQHRAGFTSATVQRCTNLGTFYEGMILRSPWRHPLVIKYLWHIVYIVALSYAYCV